MRRSFIVTVIAAVAMCMTIDRSLAQSVTLHGLVGLIFLGRVVGMVAGRAAFVQQLSQTVNDSRATIPESLSDSVGTRI